MVSFFFVKWSYLAGNWWWVLKLLEAIDVWICSDAVVDRELTGEGVEESSNSRLQSLLLVSIPLCDVDINIVEKKSKPMTALLTW